MAAYGFPDSVEMRSGLMNFLPGILQLSTKEVQLII